MRWLAVLLVLSTSTGALLAQTPPAQKTETAAAPSFAVTLDKSEVSIGDRVVATYSARIPAGASLEIEALVSPKLEVSMPGTASGPVLEFEPPAPAVVKKAEGNAGPDVWSQAVGFAPFTEGEVVLPGPMLVLVSPSGERTPVRPPSITLRVSSRLPGDKKPEALTPRADRPVRIPAHSPWFWAAITAGILAVALVAWLLWRRRKTAPVLAAIAPPAIPPGRELLEAIERLAAEADRLGNDPRAFYSELTRVTKRYLERRLDRPVLEWTTFETIRRLREDGIEIPREIGLSDLLSAADQVKFGRAGSTRDEARRHLTRARLLCDHLEARAAAQEAEAEMRAASAARSAVVSGSKEPPR